MSFYFSIPTEKKVSYKSLSSKLGFHSIAFSTEFQNSENEIIGTKIFIPGKSTRGITISFEDNSYSIGINVIASEEDFNLALHTSKSIGELTKSSILPEDRETPISPEELLNDFDQKWIDSMKTLAVNLFMNKIGNSGEVLSIGCCYMQYSVGPIIHSQLNQSSEVEYYNSLVSHIQKTQFFDRNKYAIPNIMVASAKDGSNKKRLVVFYPQGNMFLSAADYIIFPVENGRYEIPYNMLKNIANPKFTLVDETQFLVEELTEQDYSELLKSIEAELSKIDEETLKEKYLSLSEDELNDEFRRITSIPNARTKIFALIHMTALMGEYEARGIELPNSQSKSSTSNKKRDTAIGEKPLRNSNNNQKKNSNKKPWWKFW